MKLCPQRRIDLFDLREIKLSHLRLVRNRQRPYKDRAVPALSPAAASIAPAANAASRSRTRILRLSSSFKYLVTRAAANAFSSAAFRSPNSRSFSTLMTPCSNFALIKPLPTDPSQKALGISAAGSRFSTPSRENRACRGPLPRGSCAHARRTPQLWSGRRGSNPRPTAWKAVTLPLSYSRSASNPLDPSPKTLGISAAGSRFAHARKTPQVTPAQPQRLKPLEYVGLRGTAKAVPYHKPQPNSPRNLVTILWSR